MKLETESLDVVRSGQMKERGFTIAANGKAFDILSGKIYTDVPLAVVRELSTNASDAHVEAGNADKPFDVHLPNILEPWFSIRDYGTGLSSLDVEEVYTTYFRSTRTSSDEFTGCLGLGSKSPFAYTDSFSITSFFNGSKYLYSAFKNEQGCPAIALLGEAKCAEPNGLEIRINIDLNDVRKFINAAQRIYPLFNTRPNITGCEDVQFPDIEDYILDTEHFTIFRSDNANYSLSNVYPSQINVVMGQIRYHIDPNKFSNLGLGQYAKLILRMPIGSCSISASREEVHYDEKTTNNLRDAILDAVKQTREKFEAEVADEPIVLKKLGYLSKYRSIVSVSHNGIDKVMSIEKDAYELKEVRISWYRHEKLTISSDFNYPRPINWQADENSNYPVFIEQDVEIGHSERRRLKYYITQGKRAEDVAHGNVFVVKIENRQRFEELFGAPTIKLSELPKLPRAPRLPNEVPRGKSIRVLDVGSRHFRDTTDTDIVNPEKDCAIIRYNNTVKWFGNKLHGADIRDIATVLGFQNVYGISEGRFEKMCKKLNLPDITTLAKERIEKLVVELDEYALAKFKYDNHSYFGNFDINLIAGLSNECDNFIKMHTANTDNIFTFQRICNALGIDMPYATNFEDAFYKKYPILRAVDWSSDTIQTKDIISYIEMVEQCK